MKKGILRTLLLLFVFLILPISVNADSKVKFSLTKDKDNLKPGSSFTVTVNSSGASEADTLYGYTLSITYDSNKLEYAGGASSQVSDITNSGNTVTIKSKSNMDNQSGDFTVGKFNLKVKSNASSGSSNITLSVGDCLINGESSKDSCSGNASSVNVAAYGTDSTLSSLRIPNTTLNPAFSKNTTSYTAKVKDITSLSINATATDPNAKVQITDNYKNLQKGENKIDIVVTSEDGNDSTTYSINVTLEVTPTEEELLKANTTLKSLEVKNYTLDPVFESTEKKYYLTVPYKVTSLDITAKSTNEKAKVEVEGNKKLIVGKNTVKITVTSEDTKNKEVYQILVTRKDEEKKVKQTCPDTTSNREWIIYSISMLIIFSLGIILGYILCKKDVFKKIFRKRVKEETPVEIETLSDTIDVSGVVKEIKKKK